ncbi:hypothetical protein BD779DRAFT_1802111 [Infundibulicybe gibba]|nr:hypothetical protein BD779DRAFT_1802111 [Infundibulicybe gibba]
MAARTPSLPRWDSNRTKEPVRWARKYNLIEYCDCLPIGAFGARGGSPGSKLEKWRRVASRSSGRGSWSIRPVLGDIIITVTTVNIRRASTHEHQMVHPLWEQPAPGDCLRSAACSAGGYVFTMPGRWNNSGRAPCCYTSRGTQQFLFDVTGADIKLTATHDKVGAWNGLGSAVLAVWQQISLTHL